MKYLKRYKIFENLNTTIDDVNDILIELNDLGFKCKASEGEKPLVSGSTPLTSFKVPIGYKLVKTHDVIIVSFSKDKPGFDWQDIKDVYWRLKSFLEDNGWTEDNNNLQDRLLDREDKVKQIKNAGKLLHAVTGFTKPISDEK